VRIAIAEGISGDRALPIVLDEPCAALDDERLAAAHRAFATLARGGRQVVILSADERLAGWDVTWERLSVAPERTEGSHRRAA
jgi:DNA repair exonuclease SbcCD ATPase subunit